MPFATDLALLAEGRRYAALPQVRLLEAIAVEGSITRAAKAAGVSYKTAWDMVDAMNNLSPQPLVTRAAGGRGGGGTQLTEAGHALVKVYRAIEAEQHRMLAALHLDDVPATLDLLRRFRTMRTSARNQFLGRISAIRTGAVNDEIELELAGGARLVAIITSDSRASLGLEVGGEAIALVKASSIMVATGLGDALLSARNQLTGIVASLTPGAVNTEVVIDLDGGNSVCAIVTHDSAERMALAVGQQATALFKASQVILAVAA